MTRLKKIHKNLNALQMFVMERGWREIRHYRCCIGNVHSIHLNEKIVNADLTGEQKFCFHSDGS